MKKLVVQQTLCFGQSLFWDIGMPFFSHWFCKIILLYQVLLNDNFMQQNIIMIQTFLEIKLFAWFCKLRYDLVQWHELAKSKGESICQITKWKPPKTKVGDQNAGSVTLTTFFIKHMYKSFVCTTDKIWDFDLLGCFYILFL